METNENQNQNEPIKEQANTNNWEEVKKGEVVGQKEEDKK